MAGPAAAQGKVLTLGDMKAMMRYNDWQHDPLAHANPTFAICGRGDLQSGGALDSVALPKGCFDSKVRSPGLQGL